MNIIKKVKRQVGMTTRLIGDAAWYNGLYIAPTTGMFINATTMLKKDGYHASLHRVTTITKLLDNPPKDKSTPLYFDEGCDIEQIKKLENRGYNVKDVVVADYSMGNTAKVFLDEFVFGEPVVPISSMYAPQINKVVYDIPNGTTIVYFADDTKEIARVMDGDTFDKETGVLQCIAKKMYGSRSRFLKDVVNKGVVIKKKEKKKKTVASMDRFLNGEICIKCNKNQKIALMLLLDDTEARWGHQVMPTEFNNPYFIDAKTVYIGVCRDYEYKLMEWDENIEPFLEEGYEVVAYQDFVK